MQEMTVLLYFIVQPIPVPTVRYIDLDCVMQPSLKLAVGVYDKITKYINGSAILEFQLISWSQNHSIQIQTMFVHST